MKCCCYNCAYKLGWNGEKFCAGQPQFLLKLNTLHCIKCNKELKLEKETYTWQSLMAMGLPEDIMDQKRIIDNFFSESYEIPYSLLNDFKQIVQYEEVYENAELDRCGILWDQFLDDNKYEGIRDFSEYKVKK
jgi:hypothetical protein